MTDYKKLVSALRVDPFEVESEGLAKVMNAAADAIETLQDKFKELGELLDEASVAADVSEMRVEELQAEVKKAAKRNAELHAELEKWVSAAEKAGEPKRGEWKPFDLTWGRSIYSCTACGESADVPTANGKALYKYCPNCGAKMEVQDG